MDAWDTLVGLSSTTGDAWVRLQNPKAGKTYVADKALTFSAAPKEKLFSAAPVTLTFSMSPQQLRFVNKPSNASIKGAPMEITFRANTAAR